jgi:high-affinity iron transporter
MLINTFILFLRDALPLFVLLSLLFVLLVPSIQWLLPAVLLGLFGCLLFINQIDLISNLFNGAGMELALFFCHFLVYLNVWVLGYLHFSGKAKPSISWRLASGTMVTVTLLINGTNFLVYFNGFWSQANAPQAMLLGTLLGLGICSSLAILLHFSMLWLSERWGEKVIVIMLLFFSVGQFADAVSLLVQVDWLNHSAKLWDSSWLISDQSEFGHFFTALFGYSDSPSVNFVSVYSTALLLPILAYWSRFIYTKTSTEKHI